VRQIVQSQDETKLDADTVTEQVLEQVKPDLDNLNEISSQICEQIEILKQQINQRAQRSELQEVKQEIDSSITEIEGLLQRSQERLAVVENITNEYVSFKEHSNTRVTELSERLSMLK
jgi:hypothetical protein